MCRAKHYLCWPNGAGSNLTTQEEKDDEDPVGYHAKNLRDSSIPQAIDVIRDEDWDYLVELNLINVTAMTRAIVPGMKQRGWGRVIPISSIMGLASTPERNTYSAAKAALIAMAKASALDLGPFGITVNCIAPGPVATEMPMSILSQEQQDMLAAKTAVAAGAHRTK